jgi:hypothetical protein
MPTLLAIADEAIEWPCLLLQCVRSLLALSGHTETICYLSAFGAKLTLRNTDTPLCCNPRGRNGSIREALPAGKRARVISMATWRERRAWRREFRSLGIRQVKERERASMYSRKRSEGIIILTYSSAPPPPALNCLYVAQSLLDLAP